MISGVIPRLETTIIKISHRQCATLTFAERNRLALSLSGNKPLSAN